MKLNDGRTALVKGMMVIDSSLDSEVYMPSSYVKVWSTRELPAEVLHPQDSPYNAATAEPRVRQLSLEVQNDLLTRG